MLEIGLDRERAFIPVLVLIASQYVFVRFDEIAFPTPAPQHALKIACSRKAALP
jgi:hypothetical protein